MMNSIAVPGPSVDYDMTEQEIADSFADVGLVDAMPGLRIRSY